MSMSLGMSMSVYRKRHTGSVSSLLHTSARNFDAFLRCRWGANIDSALGGGAGSDYWRFCIIEQVDNYASSLRHIV